MLKMLTVPPGGVIVVGNGRKGSARAHFLIKTDIFNIPYEH